MYSTATNTAVLKWGTPQETPERTPEPPETPTEEGGEIEVKVRGGKRGFKGRRG